MKLTIVKGNMSQNTRVNMKIVKATEKVLLAYSIFYLPSTVVEQTQKFKI